MTSYLDAENAISVVRGTNRTLLLQVTDETGAPVNLTGARVIFTVKCKITDTDPVLQKDSAAGVLQAAITNPLAGQAEFYLVPEDTKTKNIGRYVFDTWVVMADGSRFVVQGPGDFSIVPSVLVLT